MKVKEVNGAMQESGCEVCMIISCIALVLACSAGVFFGGAIFSRNHHVETSQREEEMGQVKGSGEGAIGGGWGERRENACPKTL